MANRDRIGVREIRQNLSVYLERVKGGEALEITEHGTTVAVLMPLPERATAVQRLVAEGRATAPSMGHDAIPRPLAMKLERPLSEILDETRDDRL